MLEHIKFHNLIVLLFSLFLISHPDLARVCDVIQRELRDSKPHSTTRKATQSQRLLPSLSLLLTISSSSPKVSRTLREGRQEQFDQFCEESNQESRPDDVDSCRIHHGPDAQGAAGAGLKVFCVILLFSLE